MDTLLIHKQLTGKYIMYIILESVNSIVANFCNCLMLKLALNACRMFVNPCIAHAINVAILKKTTHHIKISVHMSIDMHYNYYTYSKLKDQELFHNHWQKVAKSYRGWSSGYTLDWVAIATPLNMCSSKTVRNSYTNLKPCTQKSTVL